MDRTSRPVPVRCAQVGRTCPSCRTRGEIQRQCVARDAFGNEKGGMCVSTQLGRMECDSDMMESPEEINEPRGHTLDDIALLIRSFERDGDAFFFMGASTMADVESRIEKIHLGTQPLVRPPLPRRPLTAMDVDIPPQPPPAPPLPQPAPPLPQPTTSSRPPLKMTDCHKPVIIFDTETTGLKPAIICQLAYLIVEDGAVSTEYDQLLRLPIGVSINGQAQAVHGISNNDCATRGVDAADALGSFARQCARIMAAGGRIVAHNAKFDVRAIRETRLAHDIVDFGENQTLEEHHTFCTMFHSKTYSPLKDKAGRRKAFRNCELYWHFYQTHPSWAKLHCAMDDVHVTALNYAAGLGRGWW